MKTNAVVEKVEEAFVTVSTIRKGACGDNCAMCGGCNGEKVLTKAYAQVQVEVGDTVILESDGKSVLFAMTSLFLFPIIIPLVFYLIFSNINSVLTYIFVPASIVLTVVYIVWLSRSSSFNQRITPKIVGIVKKK